MPPTATYTILVLDDDPVFLNLATAFLAAAGHTVTALEASEPALARLQSNPPVDIVLTDLNMPGLEGQPLARALRDAIPAGTPLVGMSATQPSAETLALFDTFLLKPFNPQILPEALGTAIGNRTAGEPSTTALPQSHEPVLDEAILHSLAAAIPPAQLRKLYDMGLADIEKRLARMKEAAITGDLATIRREAHAIKGSCGMVGARELHALAAAIEGSTTFDTSALERIPEACLRLRRMLDAKLHTV